MSEARMQSRWRRALPLARLTGAVGFGAGAIIWMASGAMGGVWLHWLPFFFGAGTGLLGFLIGVFAVEGGGDFLGRLYAGRHAPTRKEYSDAQALAVRGHYRQALARFREHAAANPDDPEPLILGARILRDELGDYGAAAAWLVEARRAEGATRAQEVTIARELVGLYEERLDDPARALPELARIAEKYAGTSAGEWAGRRLAQLRTKAWSSVRDAPTEEMDEYHRKVTGRRHDSRESE